MGSRKKPGITHVDFSSALLNTPAPWNEDIELSYRYDRPQFNYANLHKPTYSLYSRAALEQAETELDLLVRVFSPVLDDRGEKEATVFARRRRVAGHVAEYKSAEYLTFRNRFFNSTQEYFEFLSDCRQELDSDGEWLRMKVEPPILSKQALARKVAGGRIEPDWKDGQNVFYAWVKKAYETKNGQGSSLAFAIRQGMSENLAKALKHVRAVSGMKSFTAGGYNARPKKYPSGYRLGTLSTHATGLAIDIDSATNIQVEAWSSLETYTGVSLSKGTRESLWAKAPEQLHAKIKLMNDTFVLNLQTALTAYRDDHRDLSENDAFAKVVEADVNLTKLKLAWVKKCRRGFFALPWPLVEALHHEKLKWGAVFDTPDLHHFEFDETAASQE